MHGTREVGHKFYDQSHLLGVEVVGQGTHGFHGLAGDLLDALHYTKDVTTGLRMTLFDEQRDGLDASENERRVPAVFIGPYTYPDPFSGDQLDSDQSLNLLKKSIV